MTAKITRRKYLRSVIAAPFLLTTPLTRAFGQDDLPIFPEQDVSILRPQDRNFEQFQPAYNKRTTLRPRARALCRTVTGLRRMVEFVRDRRLPFAIRGGGHSFEGFSQSEHLVIDTRLMNSIRIDMPSRTMDVGAGASLGDIYRAAARVGMCFPAGSCPTVGLAGHIHGGGFGLLARSYGLASDAMRSIDLVDANATLRAVTPEREPDLFWALSGGGGGTFGAAARFRLQLYPVGQVLTFSQGFVLPVQAAAQVVQSWQAWAPLAPDSITSILKISSPAPARVGLRLAGQSIGSPSQLTAELMRFAKQSGQPQSAQVNSLSFLDAVNRFSGGWTYESKFSKGKSDFVFAPLAAPAIEALLQAVASLPANNVIVICDSYGGAVGRKRNDETAFAFRKAHFCLQYYSSWQNPAQTQSRLSQINRLYDVMRRYMPGYAYINYCDLDLKDWQNAYWGANAARLRSIKAKVDPSNLFRHAQSMAA